MMADDTLPGAAHRRIALLIDADKPNKDRSPKPRQGQLAGAAIPHPSRTFGAESAGFARSGS